MSATLIIVIVTVAVSLAGFSNERLINNLIFYPPAVAQQKQWYRFFTCGFIHADLGHLAFNMIALYLFGRYLEEDFSFIFGSKGTFLYVLMYVSALWFCLLPTYKKNIDNYQYRSLGASGAVSAVVFASIVLNPLNKIGFFVIPPIIPGFIFAPVYLIISQILEKRQADNVNHSAHIWGALYGMAFLVVAAYAFSDYKVVNMFIEQVKSYLN
ncbi:MAG: rhomboid family intramembrane serine protease [Sphingobacteriales bacterium]|nr:MAG: rhomboid family intramembrane serine protease [Sphingobacteriales bacterium]